jgi:hypothetical protein
VIYRVTYILDPGYMGWSDVDASCAIHAALAVAETEGIPLESTLEPERVGAEVAE